MIQPELKTMETLLMRRLEKLFEAMDDGYGPLVDEIIDEMEMLFKLKPPIYNEVIAIKESLLEEVEKAMQEVVQLSEMARDDIQRRRFLETEMDSIDWEYRKDYLESIIEIMGKYQMIPYLQPDVTEMQSQYEIPHVDEQEQYIEEEQPPQQPVQQQPQQQRSQPQQQPQHPHPQNPSQQPIQQPNMEQQQQSQEQNIQNTEDELQYEHSPPSPIPVQTEEKKKAKIPHLSKNFDL